MTAATELNVTYTQPACRFDKQIYDNRVYQGYGKPLPKTELKTGPNIAAWPPVPPLPENLLLKVASVLKDQVTTTDELIPSGEASTYRSNPLRLAEFTLCRKDPAYLGRAKHFKQLELERLKAVETGSKEQEQYAALSKSCLEAGIPDALCSKLHNTVLGSLIVAVKPGDGSAREQAASSQKILSGQANIALEYATKRYRSNLINWGMLPFTVDKEALTLLSVDDLVYIPGIRRAVAEGASRVDAWLIKGNQFIEVALHLGNLSAEERDILLAGCLINYYRQR